MKTKCWRCDKRRKTYPGKEAYRLVISKVTFIILRLPNPICAKCFESFVKWAEAREIMLV